MDFIEYIDPKLLALVFALYILGVFLKNSLIFKDKHIPLVLCAVGVVLAVLWVLSTSFIADWQSALLAVFTACVQGVLCAGAAVLSNQLIKQSGREDL